MAVSRAGDPSRPSGPHVREVRRSYVEEMYPAFLRNNRLRNSDLRRLRGEAAAFAHKPLVSLLLPVSDPEAGPLGRTLDSVMGQAYPNWELVARCPDSAGEHALEVLSRHERLDGRVRVERVEHDASAAGLSNAALSGAAGEFAAFVGAGDELAPDALFRVVGALQGRQDADLLYTDEDEIGEGGGRTGPRFKPGWSPDLLLSGDYVGALAVYRRSLLNELGGLREGFAGAAAGAGGYDLVLRATERTRSIVHAPGVLYHRREAIDGYRAPAEGARRALSEALERRGLEGSVEAGLLPHHLRARLEIKGEPLVSLIIPTRDNVALLKNCVESIERLTEYPNYEVVIVDNDSVDPETVAYLASTRHRVIPFPEAFNYSRINNAAVSRVEGDYVLLLNDDTEVISPGWIGAMLEHAQRPEVGAVGAKLVYPDGRIQHAGVVTGVGGSFGMGISTHAHQFYPSTSPGYDGMVARVANFSAVTAACVLIRKAVFEEVGGFDEENLKISFNDVDLCLRMREKGYSVVYTPYAELYHHESVSRGYTGIPAEGVFLRERWSGVLDADPFYNPNFSRGGADFNLRADLLRPRVLQREGKPAVPDDWFYNPATMSVEARLEVADILQKAARDSRRTTIAPLRGGEGMRISAVEAIRRDGAPGGDGTPGGEAPKPAHARGTSGPVRRGSVRAEQLVWMFGSPRTGSTWLSKMMAEMEDQERWNEPYVGLLFGSFLHDRLAGAEKLLANPSFILAERHKRAWLGSVRNLVLDGAAARYPDLGVDRYLVIKEPNGSLGAPVLMEALPESRMVLLVRDPRDVIASRLDATGEGGWTGQGRDFGTSEKLAAFTRHLAEEYLRVVSGAWEVYEAHPRGRKALVRYEDLRADAAGTLKAMYADLGMAVDARRVEAAAAKHAWENVPEERKGEGKFYRKATPGGWNEDLSPEQVRIIEDVTGPVASKLY